MKKTLEYVGKTTHALAMWRLGLEDDVIRQNIPPTVLPSYDRTVADLFRLTDDELDDLAEPLTRIINRHAVIAEYVEKSDEISAGLVVAGAIIRNVGDLRAADAVAAQHMPAVVEPTEPETEEPSADVEREVDSFPGAPSTE